ncbi:MAG: hypothetical protein WCV73_00910 [Patescibacteria group bacterium]
MRKIFLLLALLATAIWPAGSVMAWSNPSHPFMVDKAAIILQKDLAAYIKKYPDFNKYLNTYLPKIKQGASDADAFSTTVGKEVYKFKVLGKSYEIYMPTSEHYYDVATGKGALKYFRSARQKADEYYATAKQKFTEKKYDDAFLFLGRAIHMVQDTTNPHHTQIGASAILNWEGFSNHAFSNREKYSVASGGIYTEPNIGTMVHNNANLCSGYFKYVDGLNRLIKWINWPVDDDYPKAGNACFSRGEKTTAGAVYMFLKDVLKLPAK